MVLLLLSVVVLSWQETGGLLLAPVAPSRLVAVRASEPGENESADELLDRAAALRREAAALASELPAAEGVAVLSAKVDRGKVGSLTWAEMRGDEEFRRSVRRQVVNAFDNLPEAESGAAFDALWAAGPSREVDAVAQLSVEADEIESAYFARRLEPERAGDAIRVLRSRIRMWLK